MIVGARGSTIKEKGDFPDPKGAGEVTTGERFTIRSFG
jgi:hypothetical protein